MKPNAGAPFLHIDKPYSPQPAPEYITTLTSNHVIPYVSAQPYTGRRNGDAPPTERFNTETREMRTEETHNSTFEKQRENKASAAVAREEKEAPPLDKTLIYDNP